MVTEPVPILVFNLAVASVLIAIFVLFRRARRDTCTWPRRLRRIAQAPGWFLVVFGVYIVIGLAVMEIREKRIVLGTGTCVAVITSTLKAIARRCGREDS